MLKHTERLIQVIESCLKNESKTARYLFKHHVFKIIIIVFLQQNPSVYPVLALC